MNLLNTDNDEAIDLTRHGLQIRRLLSFDDWKQLLEHTRKAKLLYHCILADVTTYGRQVFGDDLVNETLEQLEFDLSDAVRAEAIGLVDHATRARHDLTSEHAYVLGTMLKDQPEEREKWASLCHEKGLTAFELKKSIIAGKVLRQSDITEQSGHTGGLPTLQGVRYQFEKWSRSVKDQDTILKLPVDERRQLLDVLGPIIEFAAKIEETLHPPGNPSTPPATKQAKKPARKSAKKQARKQAQPST